jgi:hypothetical protein
MCIAAQSRWRCRQLLATERLPLTDLKVAAAWNAHVDALLADAGEGGTSEIKGKFGFLDAVHAKRHEDRLELRQEQVGMISEKAQGIIKICRAKKALRAEVLAVPQVGNPANVTVPRASTAAADIERSGASQF